MAFSNIPDEIKTYTQWINWAYETVDGRTTKIPLRVMDGRKASVAQPLDWASFDAAVSQASQQGCGIGFVFTKSDPYCGTDLDNKTANEDRSCDHKNVYQKLNSYSELSPGGAGLHIITKANLPLLGTNNQKRGIECYDNLRFFTFTGNVVNPVPIADRQSEIIELYEEIKPKVQTVEYNGMQPEFYTDAEVIAHANAAENGDKFKRLWAGDWETDYGNKSQSEADFALINIIAFYSRNATQTMRVFRQSALGRRPKANRGEYVSTMVRRSFDRMTPTATVPLNGSWFDAATVEPWLPKLTVAQLGPFTSAQWITQPQSKILPRYEPPTERQQLKEFPEPIQPMAIPGLVGELVAHTWQSSVHQIAEVSIASALSTMSLLCSRSYRHGSMGLSLYLMLLAQTSTGKSFAYSANDARFNALIQRYKSMPPPRSVDGKARGELLEKMVMGEMGSAQGLAHQMAVAPSTLAQLDEYVDNIRMMAQPNPPAFLAQIRSELLKLVEHSGPGRVYHARKYSTRNPAQSQSIDVVSASLTILATGTPEQFYDEMSTTLLTSGFLPRFTILEYEGGITKPNRNIVRTMSPELLDKLSYIFDMAINMAPTLKGDPDEFVDVLCVDQAASDKLQWFDQLCLHEAEDANQNRTNMAGMWSRAKDHVRQISALIAIGCNAPVPRITLEHTDIAMRIVMPTIEKIQRKVISGDVGTGDDKREAEIKIIVSRMVEGGYYQFRGYTGMRREFIEAGFFQLSVIRGMCVKLATFRNHRLGASKAFEDALLSLVRYGVFKMVDCNGVKCIQCTIDF